MRVLDVDELLTVAHTVDGEVQVATFDPVGILPVRTVRRRRTSATTRCGLDVGPTWVDAAPYGVPDCADCVPAAVVYEQDTL